MKNKPLSLSWDSNGVEGVDVEGLQSGIEAPLFLDAGVSSVFGRRCPTARSKHKKQTIKTERTSIVCSFCLLICFFVSFC